jgi:hypothetical protein
MRPSLGQADDLGMGYRPEQTSQRATGVHLDAPNPASANPQPAPSETETNMVMPSQQPDMWGHPMTPMFQRPRGMIGVLLLPEDLFLVCI